MQITNSKNNRECTIKLTKYPILNQRQLDFDFLAYRPIQVGIAAIYIDQLPGGMARPS